MNNCLKDEQECASCFSKSRFPGTVIEKNMRCNRCNSQDFSEELKHQATSDFSELRSLTKKVTEKSGGKYDCIIGASGGFDSSYIIYVAKKVLDMNPLVVKYDHGFNYEIADYNLRTICEKLDIDFKIIKSKRRNDYKYVRFIVLALKNIELYWGICNFCRHAGGSVVLKEALKHNIPLILESVNLHEKNLFLSKAVKIKIIWAQVIKMSFTKWAKMILYLLLAYYHLLMFRVEFLVPPIFNMIRAYPRSNKVKKLYLSKYIEWDIYGIAEQLMKEVGWKCPHPAMPMRFDCQIEDSFFNYTLKKATGNTSHSIICNNLIYGKIKTKDELRSIVNHYNNILGTRMKEMFVRLNIN